MAFNCPNCQTPIENVIPKDRFDQVNNQKKELTDKLAEIEKTTADLTDYSAKYKDLENKYNDLKLEHTTFKEVAAFGFTDKSLIKAFKDSYNDMEGEKPAFKDYIADLQANPDKAPLILRPHLKKETIVTAETHKEESVAAVITPEVKQETKKAAVESGSKVVSTTQPTYTAEGIKSKSLNDYKAERDSILKDIARTSS